MTIVLIVGLPILSSDFLGPTLGGQSRTTIRQMQDRVVIQVDPRLTYSAPKDGREYEQLPLCRFELTGNVLDVVLIEHRVFVHVSKGERFKVFEL